MRMESLEAGSDDIQITTGLPYKNVEKFSLDDSALWKTDEDIISDDNHSRYNRQAEKSRSRDIVDVNMGCE